MEKRLTDDQIEKMLEDAQKMKKIDELNKKRVEAKNDLEQYLFSLSNSLYNLKIRSDEKELIQKIIEQTLAWLDYEGEKATFEDIQKKQKGVEFIIVPILTGGN